MGHNGAMTNLANIAGPRAAGFRRPVLAAAARLAAAWRRAIARARQRRALAALDDRLLRDIGGTRAAARFEARKPFWRE